MTWVDPNTIQLAQDSNAVQLDVPSKNNYAAKFGPLLVDSKGQLRAVQCRGLDQEGRQQKNMKNFEGGEESEVVVDWQQYFVIDFK